MVAASRDKFCLTFLKICAIIKEKRRLNMTINGIAILASQALFSPTTYGILIMSLSFMLFAILLDSFFINFDKPIYFIMSIFFFILMVVSIILTSADTQTILNKYCKTQYTIEILDDNAWKEIGPNYEVIEKLYESKEIYVIEGEKELK